MPELVSEIRVISSVIVQTRPQALASISRGIEAIPGAEVHGDDPVGKLIVVTETDDDASLNTIMNKIGSMAGVLSVNLVFHHNETTPSDDFNGSWRG